MQLFFAKSVLWQFVKSRAQHFPRERCDIGHGCLKIEFKAGKEECSRIVEIVMGKQLTALTMDGENQRTIV